MCGDGRDQSGYPSLRFDFRKNNRMYFDGHNALYMYMKFSKGK